MSPPFLLSSRLAFSSSSRRIAGRRSVRRFTLARRRNLDHPDFAATFWPGIEISQRIETTGNEAGGDMCVHADGLTPGADVEAGDHDAEECAPSCAQYRFDDLKFPL